MNTKARRAAKKAWIKKHRVLRMELEQKRMEKAAEFFGDMPAFSTNIGDNGEALEGERVFYTDEEGYIVKEEYEPPEGCHYKTWEEEVAARESVKAVLN